MKFLNKIYLLLSLAVLPIITNLKSEILPKQITPENTVFAFDLHDVVLKTQTYKATIDFIKKFPHLTAIKLIFTPGAIKEIRKQHKRYGKSPKFFDEVAKKYPEISKCKSTILELTNYQDVNTEMVDIIKKIKQLGYRTYVFSNISTESLDYLKQNQKELMALFDGVQNPNEQNNYTRKPDPKAYVLFKSYLKQNNDYNKSIIFLDDDIKNVSVANKYGFTGIRYKSADKFKQKLIKYGVEL